METERNPGNGAIVIPVKLDEKTFRRFARFDTLRLKKRWVRPLVFFLILTGFAAIALFSRREQSALIASVLLAVAVGLPLVYIGSFLSQVNVQAMRNRLKPARQVYTVQLDEEGLTVQNHQKKEEMLRLPWAELWRAYRVSHCVYLYAAPNKAFLLPDGQANVTDREVWQFLTERMGGEKCVATHRGWRP